MGKAYTACFHRSNHVVPIASVLKEIVVIANAVSESSSKLSCYELFRFLLKQLSNGSVAAREKARTPSLGIDVEEVGGRNDRAPTNPSPCRGTVQSWMNGRTKVIRSDCSSIA